MTYSFADLAKINVNDHVEKKGGLTYLSWVWAVDQLFRIDPQANWEIQFFDGKPYSSCGEFAMVFIKLHACGVTRQAFLPVMDHRNKAIPNPNSFEINTALQRCLVKAIAHLGLGLYIYAGEDLPPDSSESESSPPPAISEPATVGSDDLQTIRMLLAATGVKPEQICKKYQIKKLEHLPISKVTETVDRLQEILSQEVEKETN